MMVLLKICVSIYAMKMLAKETAVFVPIAVPSVVLSTELERISFRIILLHEKFLQFDWL